MRIIAKIQNRQINKTPTNTDMDHPHPDSPRQFLAILNLGQISVRDKIQQYIIKKILKYFLNTQIINQKFL